MVLFQLANDLVDRFATQPSYLIGGIAIAVTGVTFFSAYEVIKNLNRSE